MMMAAEEVSRYKHAQHLVSALDSDTSGVIFLKMTIWASDLSSAHCIKPYLIPKPVVTA